MINRKSISLCLLLGALLALAVLTVVWRSRPITSLPRVFSATDRITSLAFSPDGQTLATGHEVDVSGQGGWAYATGAVQFRDVTSGVVTRTVPFFYKSTIISDDMKNGGPVGWLAYSPNGKLLMVSNLNAGDGDTVGVMDIATSHWKIALRGSNYAHTPYYYRPLGFSRDNKVAYVLQFQPDNTARIRDELASSQEQWRHIAYHVNLLAYDMESGRILRRYLDILDRGQWPVQGVLSADGKAIVVASRLGNGSFMFDEGKLTWIDADIGKRLQSLETQHGAFSMAAVPQDDLIAQASNDGSLFVSSLHQSQIKSLKTPDGDGAWQVALSPDGKYLAACTTRNVLCLWNLPNRRFIGVLSPQEKSVRSIDFSPDSRILATTSNKILKLWAIQ